MGERKGGMGKRGAASTAARLSGGEAVESVTTPEPQTAASPVPAPADPLVAARAEWSDLRQAVLKQGDHAGAAERARELVAGLTRAQAVALAGLLPSATKKAALRQLLDTIDADYFTYAKLIEVDRAARKAGKDFGGM